MIYRFIVCLYLRRDEAKLLCLLAASKGTIDRFIGERCLIGIDKILPVLRVKQLTDDFVYGAG
jgi:hypothetical protein